MTPVAAIALALLATGAVAETECRDMDLPVRVCAADGLGFSQPEPDPADYLSRFKPNYIELALTDPEGAGVSVTLLTNSAARKPDLGTLATWQATYLDRLAARGAALSDGAAFRHRGAPGFGAHFASVEGDEGTAVGVVFALELRGGTIMALISHRGAAAPADLDRWAAAVLSGIYPLGPS